ncbi:hypothetical protein QF037_000545 [Streptomyces canus]|uniref:hypothetical protein n=1 Tax=Streptomyces canus TaxID=58343 RepID=UPI00277E91DF|nr:hypothetical protein [Streptomyces canus]MDQ0596200.1 hypothetical protein [Streptomyces canus]
MPRGVKGALVAVWCQAVHNGLAGWLGWTLMNDRPTHHQEVEALGAAFTADERGTASGDQEQEVDLLLRTKR